MLPLEASDVSKPIFMEPEVSYYEGSWQAYLKASGKFKAHLKELPICLFCGKKAKKNHTNCLLVVKNLKVILMDIFAEKCSANMRFQPKYLIDMINLNVKNAPAQLGQKIESIIFEYNKNIEEKLSIALNPQIFI